ncbi:MAG: hypothetical protein K9K93_02110 [Acholeplasmataceae bacterium]|nr:hypothetical protein [Acholeplasmataceae bacterium]
MHTPYQTITQKIKILKEVATTLKAHGVLFAVGGSCLLYVHGLVHDFDDIDLMINASDCQKVRTILDRMGNRDITPPSSRYRTACFLEYDIRGVDVDVMGGLAYQQPDGSLASMPFDGHMIQERRQVDDVKIPLARLSDWMSIYQMIERPEKAALIKAFLDR